VLTSAERIIEAEFGKLADEIGTYEWSLVLRPEVVSNKIVTMLNYSKYVSWWQPWRLSRVLWKGRWTVAI